MKAVIKMNWYIHLLCLLFCKFSRWQARRFSQVGPHLICLLFVLPLVAGAISRMEIGGRRRLSAQKRNGLTLSMAAQPFISTIDGVRLFCYLKKHSC